MIPKKFINLLKLGEKRTTKFISDFRKLINFLNSHITQNKSNSLYTITWSCNPWLAITQPLDHPILCLVNSWSLAPKVKEAESNSESESSLLAQFWSHCCVWDATDTRLGSEILTVAPKYNWYKAVPFVQSQLNTAFRGSTRPNVQN